MARRRAEPVAPARPLVLTRDPALLDELLRICADVATEPLVFADPGEARDAWRLAPLVLVGIDVAGELVGRRLPRRDGVVIVARAPADDRVWRWGLQVGASEIALLPEAEGWLAGELAVDHRGRAALLAVTGARGGAGASTLAVALSVAAARDGAAVVLIDGDAWGGGLDLLLGAESLPGIRWPDVSGARGRLAASSFHDGLPARRGVRVLSWTRAVPEPVEPAAVAAVLTAARTGCDLVVVDLPRGSDPVVREVLVAADRALLVVPAEVRATAAAALLAEGMSRLTPTAVAVRTPGPAGLRPEAVAAAVGLPLAGEVRDDPAAAVAGERGAAGPVRARGPVADFCVAYLADLADLDHGVVPGTAAHPA